MTTKLKSALLLFLLLTVLNAILFYYRDNFQYIPSSNLNSLYKPCDKDCQQKWNAFVKPYPAEELQEAAKISSPWVANKSTTLEKVIAIGNHIYQEFNDQAGGPSALLLTQSPLQQYKSLSSQPSEELWCGIYAQMLSYFCISQNITTRYIEIMNPADHHVINECYIPELGKWVMIDPTFNLLLVKDSNGNLLDLQQFRNELKQNHALYAVQTTDLTKSTVLNKKESYINTYYVSDVPHNYHYYTSNAYAYKPLEKLKRYFLPVSWYEIYGSPRSSNFLYIIKVVSFLLWIISFGFFLRQFKIK